MKKVLFLSIVFIFLLNFMIVNAVSPKLTVYYMNWSPYSPLNQNQQVRDLPWDRLSAINHAFFRIVPNEDFTEFGIESITPSQDFRVGGAFDQYAEMHQLFPDVKITVSVGGWTDTRWFSLMASTDYGRASFIQACIDLLIEFPFLRGIDIDWEFPGSARNHEGDEALMGGPHDRDNLTLLVREMREAFDMAGFYDHVITIAVPSDTNSMRNGNIVFDFTGLYPYLNQIKIMTYDMSGPWTGRANHHTALFQSNGVSSGVSVNEAVEYIMSLGIPPEMISIGSPLYSHGWIVEAADGWDALGKSSREHPPSPLSPGQRHWHDIMALMQEPGWNLYHDEEAEASFIFNSDPNSQHFRHFYTFESERSLQAKLDYINELGLGGIIVWATAGDAMYPVADFPMLTRMSVAFGIYDGEIPTFPILIIEEPEEDLGLVAIEDVVQTLSPPVPIPTDEPEPIEDETSNVRFIVFATIPVVFFVLLILFFKHRKNPPH